MIVFSILIANIQRIIEILREDGVIALLKAIRRFLKYRIKYFRNWIHIQRAKIRESKYRLQYGRSFPDSEKIIHINPNDIEYMVLSSSVTKPGTFIRDGEWDKKQTDINIDTIPLYSDKSTYCSLIKKYPWTYFQISDLENYQSFINHFEHGMTWQETDFYERLLRKTGNNSPKYSNKEKTIDRLSYCDDLYESIHNNGYLTQNDIVNNTTNNSFSSKAARNDELGVGITREGEFIYIRNGGAHRLLLAKILDIESIPAKIKLRHKEWQQLRKDIYNNGFSEKYTDELRDHPDLQDVIGD